MNEKELPKQAAQPAQPGWRTIESAPKDGTEILAIGNNYGRTDSDKHYKIAWWNGECWTDSDEFDESLPHLTHWQPLPAAPSTKEKTE